MISFVVWLTRKIFYFNFNIVRHHENAYKYTIQEKTSLPTNEAAKKKTK